MKPKAQGLWNKQNGSRAVAASIRRDVGRMLKTRSETQWNSLYDAMEVLLEVLKVNMRLLNAICTENNLPTFTRLTKT